MKTKNEGLLEIFIGVGIALVLFAAVGTWAFFAFKDLLTL